MNKLLLSVMLTLTLINLEAFGACLIEDIVKKGEFCGAASQIQQTANPQKEQSNIEDLKNIYQIPTMASPKSFNNNFPILNQNCMFGNCIPDFRQ